MKPADNLKIVFMGTPEFAVPTLEAIHGVFGIETAVTVPDKPRGRGKKVIPSDVKVRASELGIPVLQPVSLKDGDFISKIKKIEPDIIVVVAFRILPKEVYQLAKLGAFNIHASLLPELRGAAPINWAIIRGMKRTGLTSFLLNEKVDTGSVLIRHEVEIPEHATAGELHDRLMLISPEIALRTCRMLIDGNYTTEIQDNSKATPAPKIFPEDCGIDWKTDNDIVKNFIHGLSPYPGAWSIWAGQRLKILRCQPAFQDFGSPGDYKVEDGNFFVQTGDGSVKITEIQLQGRKAMKTDDFLRGYRGESKGKLG